MLFILEKNWCFIDLVERANIANRANATIFVSIHCNANKNTAADGTETYVMGMTKIASI
jgi:N-acetylmuramoyl-L-alanine amidase